MGVSLGPHIGNVGSNCRINLDEDKIIIFTKNYQIFSTEFLDRVEIIPENWEIRVSSQRTCAISELLLFSVPNYNFLYVFFLFCAVKIGIKKNSRRSANDSYKNVRYCTRAVNCSPRWVANALSVRYFSSRIYHTRDKKILFSVFVNEITI